MNTRSSWAVSRHFVHIAFALLAGLFTTAPQAAGTLQVMVCNKNGCTDPTLGRELTYEQLSRIFSDATAIIQTPSNSWFDDWKKASVAQAAKTCLALVPGGPLAPLSQSISRDKKYETLAKYQIPEGQDFALAPDVTQRVEYCQDLGENGIQIQCESLMNNTAVIDERRRFPLSVTLVRDTIPAKVSSYAQCSLSSQGLDKSNVQVKEFSSMSVLLRDGLSAATDASNQIIYVELPVDYKPSNPFQQGEQLYFFAHGSLVVTADAIKDRSGQPLRITSKLVVLP